MDCILFHRLIHRITSTVELNIFPIKRLREDLNVKSKDLTGRYFEIQQERLSEFNVFISEDCEVMHFNWWARKD